MLASENCVLCNYAAFANVLICNGQQRFIRFRLHPKSVTSICSIVRNIYTANMTHDTERRIKCIALIDSVKCIQFFFDKSMVMFSKWL